jgi:thymidylate synthase (FAD)
MLSYPILDHGYIRLVETWGRGDAGLAEAGIVEAARQSTQGSFRGWDTDKKLLETLFSSKPQHATPFEFAGMVIEVQAPIFVFREWHRHRTQSYNEMSARYAPLPNLNYIASEERLMMGVVSTTNKQAQGIKDALPMVNSTAKLYRAKVQKEYERDQEFYEWSLENGVPKELARVHLPVGRYSRMRAATNVRNWFAFLTLRLDPMAQWEIRQYAAAVADIMSKEFPQTYSLFQRL